LNLILDNVRVVSRGVSDIFEQLLRLDDEDLVIGLGFPRYSSRTVDVLRYAKKNGATVVALTDSLLSPLSAEANYTLLAQSNMASFVDSLVAPMSVINALIVAVGLREKDTISQSFEKLERIWDENKVYADRNKQSDLSEY
jgi:DNA-binding MurR/RpiR family transcriptional regulator